MNDLFGFHPPLIAEASIGIIIIISAKQIVR